MPAGQQLIEAVAATLVHDSGTSTRAIQSMMGAGRTARAIRYAIAALIKTGRARRDSPYGPVYAVGDGK